jgi:hypothetical protein
MKEMLSFAPLLTRASGVILAFYHDSFLTRFLLFTAMLVQGMSLRRVEFPLLKFQSASQPESMSIREMQS